MTAVARAVLGVVWVVWTDWPEDVVAGRAVGVFGAGALVAVGGLVTAVFRAVAGTSVGVAWFLSSQAVSNTANNKVSIAKRNRFFTANNSPFYN